MRKTLRNLMAGLVVLKAMALPLYAHVHTGWDLPLDGFGGNRPAVSVLSDFARARRLERIKKLKVMQQERKLMQLSPGLSWATPPINDGIVGAAAAKNTLPVVKLKDLKLQATSTCELNVMAAAFDNGSTDADGDELTFTFFEDGLEEHTYAFGTHLVEIEVSDGKSFVRASAKLVVEDKTLPTAITKDITIRLNAAGEASITAAEINDGSSDMCGEVTLSASKLSFYCADLGENRVTLTVTDGNGNAATAEAVVSVLDEMAPVLPANYSFSIEENAAQGTLLGSIRASDNCNALSYYIKAGNVNGAFSINSNEGSLQVANTAALDYETYQQFTLTVEATDNSNNAATSQVVVSLQNLNDHAPAIGVDIAEAQQTLEDELYTYTLPEGAFTDPDVDDALSYSAPDLPAWLSFDAEKQTLYGTPLNEHVGTYQINIRASDKAFQWAEQTLRLEVVNTNDAPYAAALAMADLKQQTQEDEPYTYTLPEGAFSDVDAGDVLSFSAPVLPSWLSFHAESRTLSGTPLNEHVGTHQIKIRATDKGLQWAEHTLELVVLNTNDAPHGIVLSNNVVDENEPAATLLGYLSSLDVDAADHHTYSLVSGAGDSDNAYFRIDGSALLTLRPLDFEERASYSVLVRTTDQQGGSFEQALEIFVVDLPDSGPFLPNLFSPNGDGSNDHFILRAYNLEQLQLRVYNKQGRLVYQTTDIEEATHKGWDGTTNGTPQPAGTYVWQLSGRHKDGKALTVEGKTFGNLSLIR